MPEDLEKHEVEQILDMRQYPAARWTTILSSPKYNTMYISKGSIWPVEDDSINCEDIMCKFLVKWKDLSYVHLSWESEEDLRVLATESVHKCLDVFLDKYARGVPIFPDLGLGELFPPEYLAIERVVDIKSCDDENDKEIALSIYGLHEANVILTVKWRYLQNDLCTMEDVCDLQNSGILYMDQLADFLDQQVQPYYQVSSFNLDSIWSNELPPKLPNKNILYSHQWRGVRWLLDIWRKRENGCLLTDEFGLGKYIQVYTFLHLIYTRTLFRSSGNILFVVPETKIEKIAFELEFWTNLKPIKVQGTNDSKVKYVCIPDRQENNSAPLVVITSLNDCADKHLSSLSWEVVIVDKAFMKSFSLQNGTSIWASFASVGLWIAMGANPIQFIQDLAKSANVVRDYWSCLNFFCPEKFQSVSDFVSQIFNGMYAEYVLSRSRENIEWPVKSSLEIHPEFRNSLFSFEILNVEMGNIQREDYICVYLRQFDFLSQLKPRDASGTQSSLAQEDISKLYNLGDQLRRCSIDSRMLPRNVRKSKLKKTAQLTLDMMFQLSGKMKFLDQVICGISTKKSKMMILTQFRSSLDILSQYFSMKEKRLFRVDFSMAVLDIAKVLNEFLSHSSGVLIVGARALFNFSISSILCSVLSQLDHILFYDGLLDLDGRNESIIDHLLANVPLESRASALRKSKERIRVIRFITNNSIEKLLYEASRSSKLIDNDGMFLSKSLRGFDITKAVFMGWPSQGHLMEVLLRQSLIMRLDSPVEKSSFGFWPKLLSTARSLLSDNNVDCYRISAEYIKNFVSKPALSNLSLAHPSSVSNMSNKIFSKSGSSSPSSPQFNPSPTSASSGRTNPLLSKKPSSNSFSNSSASFGSFNSINSTNMNPNQISSVPANDVDLSPVFLPYAPRFISSNDSDSSSASWSSETRDALLFGLLNGGFLNWKLVQKLSGLTHWSIRSIAMKSLEMMTVLLIICCDEKEEVNNPWLSNIIEFSKSMYSGKFERSKAVCSLLCSSSCLIRFLRCIIFTMKSKSSSHPATGQLSPRDEDGASNSSSVLNSSICLWCWSSFLNSIDPIHSTTFSPGIHSQLCPCCLPCEVEAEVMKFPVDTSRMSSQVYGTLATIQQKTVTFAQYLESSVATSSSILKEPSFLSKIRRSPGGLQQILGQLDYGFRVQVCFRVLGNNTENLRRSLEQRFSQLCFGKLVLPSEELCGRFQEEWILTCMRDYGWPSEYSSNSALFEGNVIDVTNSSMESLGLSSTKKTSIPPDVNSIGARNIKEETPSNRNPPIIVKSDINWTSDRRWPRMSDALGVIRNNSSTSYRSLSVRSARRHPVPNVADFDRRLRLIVDTLSSPPQSVDISNHVGIGEQCLERRILITLRRFGCPHGVLSALSRDSLARYTIEEFRDKSELAGFSNNGLVRCLEEVYFGISDGGRLPNSEFGLDISMSVLPPYAKNIYRNIFEYIDCIRFLVIIGESIPEMLHSTAVVFSKLPAYWTMGHSTRFLVGILIHGWGEWVDIYSDPSLQLMPSKDAMIFDNSEITPQKLECAAMLLASSIVPVLCHWPMHEKPPTALICIKYYLTHHCVPNSPSDVIGMT